jgi:hypothetical protein
MHKAIGFLSFVFIAGGISGLLHQWLGFFRLFGFLHRLAPDGYETYTDLGYIVLGIALAAAAEALRKQTPRA